MPAYTIFIDSLLSPPFDDDDEAPLLAGGYNGISDCPGVLESGLELGVGVGPVLVILHC